MYRISKQIVKPYRSFFYDKWPSDDVDSKIPPTPFGKGGKGGFSRSMRMAQSAITGRLLFESDVELRLQYEIKIKGMYFDFQPFLSGLRVRKAAKLGPMMV